MSRALSAFLARKDAPGRSELQKAVDGLGFKVVIDDAYVPLKTSGYLPCTFDGEDAGFTIKFLEVDPKAERPEELKAALGDRDVEVTFRWSGDPREAVSALAVAAALTTGFGAIVYDTGDKVLVSSDDLIAKARKAASAL
ncbi:hypothetical protein [Methylosinus sp. Sm6]|uniref:hypothetical protein n=1 Tax=Methylosinus sp. Sm6 TaxID=2866948 RepID=UPI001C99F3DA|nr:hypothetical protein [Methylosinus sp. Sm6]MBY6243221.1 hypothetical protein [Methylosinus sp. Sm6]